MIVAVLIRQDEEEIRKLAEEKRREKLEDKKARQRVMEQIAADKEARRVKLAQARGETLPEAAATPAPPAPASQPTTAAKKSYDECRIQVLLILDFQIVAVRSCKLHVFFFLLCKFSLNLVCAQTFAQTSQTSYYSSHKKLLTARPH